MRHHRKLALKRETLTQLTPAEMSAVAGGSHLCDVTDNCGETLTHGPSLDATCPTTPYLACVLDTLRDSNVICTAP